MRIRCKALWVVSAAVATAVAAWLIVRPVSNPVHEGQRLSVWFDQLHHARTPEQRQSAPDAIQAIGEAAVPFLVNRLHDRDSRWEKKYQQFYHSRRLSGWIRARLPEPRFERAEWVRLNAARAIGLLGDKAKAAVPDLAKALADESRGVQFEAARALRGIGPAVRQALPTLVETLRAADPYVADNAASVIVGVAQVAPDAVPLLAPMLGEEDKFKMRVLRILPKLGDAARAVEGDIENLLTSTNASVRFAAATALWDIFPGRHIELLPLFEGFAKRTDIELHEAGPYLNPWGRSPTAETQTTELRQAIGNRLVKMQPLTEGGAELLGSLLRDGEDSHCWFVLAALGQRSQESANAIPAVAKALEHSNPRVAAKAAEVLGRIANGQPSVVLALERAMQHPWKMVRDAAEESLQQINAKSE